MVVKDSRWGAYMTDESKTDASLHKGDAIETITDERASSCWPSAAHAGAQTPRPADPPPGGGPRLVIEATALSHAR